MKAIILAGGGGTRLWPVSRERNPKQIGAIIGEQSLLQATYMRLRRGFKVEDIYVSTAAAHQKTIRRQLPFVLARNVIAEPCRRDTAAAIGFALLHVSKREPHATFVTINSDAYVRDVPAYLHAIAAAGKVIKRRPDSVALIGIPPSYPEIGYGYIKMGKKQFAIAGAKSGSANVYAVERFVEKPDIVTARTYVADGTYLWNPTLLVARVDHFLSLYDTYLPLQAAAFRRMAPELGKRGSSVRIMSAFSRIRPISIDYGILEKEKRLVVIPADFGWADVGNWCTVRSVLAASGVENVVRGNHVGIDSNGNIVYGRPGKLVATAGVSGMVIIDTEDALLVCPLDRAHDVKKIVAQLRGRSAHKKFL